MALQDEELWLGMAVRTRVVEEQRELLAVELQNNDAPCS
jgi:hypothetical protein